MTVHGMRYEYEGCSHYPTFVSEKVKKIEMFMSKKVKC